MLLRNLSLFMLIVEKGGLAAAGREVGLSPASVSERLVDLEKHFGAKLLNRTTRSLSLTEEGLRVLQAAQRILSEVEQVESSVKSGVDHIGGPIRITAPIDLGRNRISDLLDNFIETYPDVSIDLHLSDRQVDLVGQGFDLAIRYGTLPDSSLMVRHLAKNTRMVCASPAYLARYGTPKHPQDLHDHACLLMRFGNETDNHWAFHMEDKTITLPVFGKRIANDGSVVRKWCLAGHGIARKSQWDISDDLAHGRLVRILKEYETTPIDLQVLYPKGRNQIRRIALLIEALKAAFAQPQP